MKVNFDHIYEHIGYLFYALATESRQVDSAILQTWIDQHWFPDPSRATDLQLHLVECLHTAMRQAFDNAMTPAHAFGEFRLYYEIHRIPFGPELRAKITSVATALVREYGKPGKESVLLHELMSVLNQPELAYA